MDDFGKRLVSVQVKNNLANLRWRKKRGGETMRVIEPVLTLWERKMVGESDLSERACHGSGMVVNGYALFKLTVFLERIGPLEGQARNIRAKIKV